MKNARKEPEDNVKDWLVSCNATPCEIKVYRIAQKLFSKDKIPLSNGDIRKWYTGHRHTVKSHLMKMVEKGIIIRYGFRFYIPAKY